MSYYKFFELWFVFLWMNSIVRIFWRGRSDWTVLCFWRTICLVWIIHWHTSSHPLVILIQFLTVFGSKSKWILFRQSCILCFILNRILQVIWYLHLFTIHGLNFPSKPLLWKQQNLLRRVFVGKESKQFQKLYLSLYQKVLRL